jgi:hypothetical protein
VTPSFALTLALCAAGAPWTEAGFTPTPSFAGPHPAIVRIVAPERDGVAYGSGALVAVNESSGLIITNWHVIRDASGPISVVFPDGFRSGAYPLRTDRDWDLAALAIRRPNAQPIAIANEAPRPGEELTIAGYGSGSYRAVKGRCTQYVSPGGNQPFEMVELSAPARNGDSGGPILNARGELAGTLFGSAFGRTTGSYCGRIRWFLHSTESDFQRISAQAMLAQQSRGGSPPLASLNAPLPNETGPQKVSPLRAPTEGWSGEGQGVRAIGHNPNSRAIAASPWPAAQHQAATSAANTSPTPVASIPSSIAIPIPRSDQIHSILALIGALAILYSALRFLGWAVG